MRSLAIAATLATAVVAEFQFPFKLPFKQSGSSVVEETAPKTIAIIGAGAGGSSAAYWIHLARERFGLDVEVDLIEQSSYIGGRSTTVYPYDNHTLSPIELGASIFVDANYNMMRAANEFGLELRDFKSDEFDGMGIFDGEKMLITIGNHWYDSVLRVLWRYGISAPRNAQSIVAEMMKKYTKLYAADAPRFDDIQALSEMLGFAELTNETMAGYDMGHGVSEKYIFEVLESLTRVNYGQNADSIHALEGACSLAAGGATSVKGGNFQIFEKFVEKSRARLLLNTTVHSISQKPSSDSWTVRTSKGTTNYHSVILAAPFHGSQIELMPSIASTIPEQPYVHLHVTLLTTTSPHINPAYVGLPADGVPPPALLTTYQGAREGGKEPEFNSMSYLGEVRPGEWAVKIFSDHVISDEWLQSIFGEGKMGWTYRKEWDAYPELPPTSTFPPVRLSKRLFYVNAFEPFISTMETETISSRNVVDLLLREEFDAGICGPRIAAEIEPEVAELTFFENTLKWVTEKVSEWSPPPKSERFVLGWDC